MTLNEFLALPRPPEALQLSPEDLTKFFWKYKGLLKTQERDQSFWAATNLNMKSAYEKLDEKERQLATAYRIIQEDLEVAHEVQTALLPALAKKLEGKLEIAVYHEQLNEVGGDYYDYFASSDDDDDGSFAVGVFDISGHGVSAALVMAYLKALFMQSMSQLSSPKAIVEWVNDRSIEFLQRVKKYSTVNFVRFSGDTIQYVCGGGFGVLMHDGEAHEFQRRDHFLGLRNKPFHEYELPFAKGDLLALYTDGIHESQGSDGLDYTKKRLTNLIVENASASVQDILARCLEDYRSFRTQDVDDMTLILMRKLT